MSNLNYYKISDNYHSVDDFISIKHQYVRGGDIIVDTTYKEDIDSILITQSRIGSVHYVSGEGWGLDESEEFPYGFFVAKNLVFLDDGNSITFNGVYCTSSVREITFGGDSYYVNKVPQNAIDYGPKLEFKIDGNYNLIANMSPSELYSRYGLISNINATFRSNLSSSPIKGTVYTHPRIEDESQSIPATFRILFFAPGVDGGNGFQILDLQSNNIYLDSRTEGMLVMDILGKEDHDEWRYRKRFIPFWDTVPV